MTATAAFHPNPDCFCCGPGTASQMGVRFTMRDGELVGTARVDERHQGERGIVHGGVLATLLDEALGNCARHATGISAVTASLTVDFRAPVVLPAELDAHAWVEARDGRKVHMRGDLRHDGLLVAEARGLWVVVAEEHFTGRGVPAPTPLAD